MNRLARLCASRAATSNRPFSTSGSIDQKLNDLSQQLSSIQQILENGGLAAGLSSAEVAKDKSQHLKRPTSYPREKVKVVLLENIHERAVEIFEESGFSIESHDKALRGQDLVDVAGEAHILGIRSKTKLDEDFFRQVAEKPNKLWACGCFCIGTNQVDLLAAANHGVSVFNAPFSNTRSVAEQTIAEIIMLNRGLTHRSNAMHKGQWNKSAKGSHEIRGKTLGVVGYGRIGSQVSIMAEALGMRVQYYDTVKQLQLGNAVQVESLEQLMATSDVVSLHVPAIPSTRNMINGQALSLMKPTAFLINNARGSVVDIEALAEAIEREALGGCAIDVFPDEPASNAEPFESPLQKLNNVILTPHTAGSTEEAQANIGIEVALKLANLLDTGSTSTAVNVPDVELPPLPPADHGVCRIIHMHKNQPGMLSQINSATAHCEANVVGQYLQSNPGHSYLAIDIEGAEESRRKGLLADLQAIEGTIFARLII